jgi:hypothetical protein
MAAIANIHDSKEAMLLMKRIRSLCSYAKAIIVDGRYRGELAEKIRNTFGYVLQIVISSYKKQRFKPIKQHWVIEWAFA